MVTYQVERFADVIDEIQPLLESHYQEVSTVKELTRLDPDYDRYRVMDNTGVLQVMTVRDDGVMIGYYVAVIAPSIHYRSLTYALCDIVYIDPAYRGRTVGYRLFRKMIDHLRNNCGVSVIHVHMKTDHEFRRLLSGLGFKLTEENWELHIWAQQQQ